MGIERAVHQRRRQFPFERRRLSCAGGFTSARPGDLPARAVHANHSESWLAVKPGTEDLVGTSKFFFDKYSTFYMFYLGAYQMRGGTPTGTNQVQGYDCLSTGTQDIPPSWTNTTDPNADFDTKGRVYQTVLPYNSFFDLFTVFGKPDIDLRSVGGRFEVELKGVDVYDPNYRESSQQRHQPDCTMDD